MFRITRTGGEMISEIEKRLRFRFGYDDNEPIESVLSGVDKLFQDKKMIFQSLKTGDLCCTNITIRGMSIYLQTSGDYELDMANIELLKNLFKKGALPNAKPSVGEEPKRTGVYPVSSKVDDAIGSRTVIKDT